MIEITLDTSVLRAGTAVGGRYRVDGDTTRTEVSLIWHTEGKGTEHLEVVTLLTHDDRELRPAAGRREGTFTIAVPAAPATYDGQLVQIRWLVRVRRWPAQGEAEVAEAPLVVGSVAPPAEWERA